MPTLAPAAMRGMLWISEGGRVSAAWHFGTVRQKRFQMSQAARASPRLRRAAPIDSGAATSLATPSHVFRFAAIYVLPLLLLAGAVLAGGRAWGLYESPAATPAVKRNPTYLLKCGHCGYSNWGEECPARHLPQKDGMLECPKCGRFAATWHRRGSQCIPAGLWEPR